MTEPDTETTDAQGPMKRRTAHGLMRSILLASTAGSEDMDRCRREAVALLDMVAERGLTDE